MCRTFGTTGRTRTNTRAKPNKTKRVPFDWELFFCLFADTRMVAQIGGRIISAPTIFWSQCGRGRGGNLPPASGSYPLPTKSHAGLKGSCAYSPAGILHNHAWDKNSGTRNSCFSRPSAASSPFCRGLWQSPLPPAKAGSQGPAASCWL